MGFIQGSPELTRPVWYSFVSIFPFPHRCAVPTTRQTLLCKNSNLKCGMKWPMWRGECYLPPCCNTVAGWAQSPLWYPSFKSRPFSLFVCFVFYFRSSNCSAVLVTNSLSPVCLFVCILQFMPYVLWFILSAGIFYFRKKKNWKKTWNFRLGLAFASYWASYWDWTTVHIYVYLSSVTFVRITPYYFMYNTLIIWSNEF